MGQDFLKMAHGSRYVALAWYRKDGASDPEVTTPARNETQYYA